MNKNGKICSKITSKNIPQGEKEVGSRLKMEREKFISLSLSRSPIEWDVLANSSIQE